MEAYVADLLDAATRGGAVLFAQIRVSDEVAVGCIRLRDRRYVAGAPTPYAMETGGTWHLAPGSRVTRSTGIDAEAKLLLLPKAFDELGSVRVDVRTDARNERSRAAILGIGATFERVLRSSQASRVPGEQAGPL